MPEQDLAFVQPQSSWDSDVPGNLEKLTKEWKERDDISEEVLQGKIDFDAWYATYYSGTDENHIFKDFEIGYFCKKGRAFSRGLGVLDYTFEGTPRRIAVVYLDELKLKFSELRKKSKKHDIKDYKIVKLTEDEVKEVFDTALKGGLFETNLLEEVDSSGTTYKGRICKYEVSWDTEKELENILEQLKEKEVVNIIEPQKHYVFQLPEDIFLVGYAKREWSCAGEVCREREVFRAVLSLKQKKNRITATYDEWKQSHELDELEINNLRAVEISREEAEGIFNHALKRGLMEPLL